MILTKELLIERFGFNYSDAEVYVKELIKIDFGECPIKPLTPKLPWTKNPTSQELREHADKIDIHERELIQHDRKYKRYIENSDKYITILCHYIEEEVDINIVPEQYRTKVLCKAWDEGHSDGYASYAYKLNGLVNLFREE